MVNDESANTKNSENVIFKYLQEFSKKLESLEKRVSNIGNLVNNALASGNNEISAGNKCASGNETSKQEKVILATNSVKKPSVEVKKPAGGKAECKFKLKGKNKTLKSHKLMSSDMTGLEEILSKCSDDDKKEKLFKDWLILHEQMDRVMAVIVGLSDSAMEEITNNG